MASLVERTRLAVHKQTFLNLPRQNGLRVTKVYRVLNRHIYVKRQTLQSVPRDQVSPLLVVYCRHIKFCKQNTAMLNFWAVDLL